MSASRELDGFDLVARREERVPYLILPFPRPRIAALRDHRCRCERANMIFSCQIEPLAGTGKSRQCASAPALRYGHEQTVVG